MKPDTQFKIERVTQASTFALTLRCRHLEVLNNSEQDFHSANSITNLV